MAMKNTWLVNLLFLSCFAYIAGAATTVTLCIVGIIGPVGWLVAGICAAGYLGCLWMLGLILQAD